jgi:predicted NAD-dependent protein-ADP-ribosyltransferase YbiA (DUF1768 family)
MEDDLVVLNADLNPSSDNTEEPPFILGEGDNKMQKPIIECEREVRIIYGPNDPLSNFYLSPLLYGNWWYKSLEHGYKHIRAMNQGLPNLANQILGMETAFHVKILTRHMYQGGSKKESIELKKKLLTAKNNQCQQFQSELKMSGKKILIQSTNIRDTFWSSGLLPHEINAAEKGEYKGSNHFGRILTKMREKEQDKSS